MGEPSPKREESDFPDTSAAFPRLTVEQMDALGSKGQRRKVAPGEVLFRAGEPCDEFYVILSGSIDIVEDHGCDSERTLSTHGAGRFLGELNLLSGQPEFVTAAAREPSEVLAVPVSELRSLMGRDTNLSDAILRACIARRSMLIGRGSGLRILGSRYSPDTKRLREFANRNRIPHRFIDLEVEEEAEHILRDLQVAPSET
ncbi:MAG TPA: cyclic nucleotide-binding domain-containing protein, partial [Actinomycetota bacterium]|nr:cyclic nucleotide-binding domain-containing protein [Actinomycetota bacterium]